MRPALVLALLALLAALAVVRSGPPAPRASDAPMTEFSASRARTILAEIIDDGAPHPVGTAAHDRVREVLAGKLAALGLGAQRSTRFVCGSSTCATVTDLVARIPGRVGANAVMLTAHYDSVPAGPGASDDGMGVATVLEVARALRASPETRRPVWLVFTDGEELGLFGAKAFVANPSLVGQVSTVVNVEARGTAGPSLMFETSRDNAGLVRAFAASTDHPVASSLFPTLYSMLPNDTDLTVYKANGLAGLNYAIIGGAARYHTPKDDLAHADLASLQHQGDNVLAIARTLADAAEPTTAPDDLVFFDCLGTFVVRWPARAALPIALGLLAILGVSAVAAVRKGLLTYADHAFGLLGVLGVVAAGAVGFAAGLVLQARAAWVAHPAGMIVASASLGALTMAAVVMLTARRAGAAGMWWGTATMLGILGVAVSVRFPGLSFLFVAPTAGACVGTVAWTFGTGTSPGRRERWAMLMPVGAVLVSAPPLGLLYDALGTHFLAVLAVGTAVVVWSSAPALASLSRREGRVVLVGLALAAVGSMVLARVRATFDADVPEHVSVRSFAVEGQPARAMLFAPDGAPETLLRMFPLHEPAWPWSHAEAAGVSTATPDVPEPAPTLEVVSSTDTPSRRIALRLRSSRGAAIVGLAVRPEDGVLAVRMHGETLAPPEPVSHREARWSSYECLTTTEDGIDVELTAPAGPPLEVYVYDRKPGLPGGELGKVLEARGAAAVPYGAGDYSIVARKVALP